MRENERCAALYSDAPISPGVIGRKIAAPPVIRRLACVEPHLGQVAGAWDCENERRSSKICPQSAHWNSYVGMMIP